MGRLRVNMGLQPQGFTWHLEPGGDFTTPECVCVFSSDGLGSMSRQFHGLVREHLIPPGWRHVQVVRPQTVVTLVLQLTRTDDTSASKLFCKYMYIHICDFKFIDSHNIEPNEHVFDRIL